MLASRPRGTLYIGVTGELVRRVWEHRCGAVPGFSSKRTGLMIKGDALRSLNYQLRWAAAYLTDRYYLGERRATYQLEGYAIEDPFRPFSVDMALGFIAVSRVCDPPCIEEACRHLLFMSLTFVDDHLLSGTKPDDLDISLPWMLYEHYVQLGEGRTDRSLMGQFALPVFQFIFQSDAYKLTSYELGRGIVETLEQMIPVAKRFEQMFDVVFD